eukprot:GHUV01039528.1.p1 GENE.GHUV01039528.1~~GHUV01039528.1.p1  ORF type:complete len:127 (-),score=29.04 GHUV01039528.1:54-434(-)
MHVRVHAGLSELQSEQLTPCPWHPPTWVLERDCPPSGSALLLMQAKDAENALIKARHGGDSQAALNDLAESPAEIASKFNGTCKRLTAAQALAVYFSNGGVLLGLLSIFIFAFTQTTRIIGDWWIR